MSFSDRIQDKVGQSPGVTDRELTDLLVGKGKGPQAVNQACRALEARGVIARRRRPDGRIGNYPLEDAPPDTQPSGHEPPTQPGDPLSEDALKQVLKAWLESEGWKVEVAWGKTPGVDILAEKDGRRWIIEVKGPGSRNAMRVNYFLAILGETLQRMNDPDAMYSIALPDLPQYRGLWDRLPPLAKGRTGISLLLVAEDGTLTVLDHNHRDPIPGAGPQAPKPRKSLTIKLAGSEGDGWPPYKRKRLILAWVTAALLVPWTGLWTLILVPLTIFVAPLAVLTIPLFLLVVGAPGAWAFNAIVEEYMRRAHWRSLAAASGDPTDS